VVVRRQLKRRQVIAFFQKLPPCQSSPYICADPVVQDRLEVY